MVLQLPHLFEAGLQTAESGKYAQMFGFSGPEGAATLMTVFFLFLGARVFEEEGGRGMQGGGLVMVCFGVYGIFFIRRTLNHDILRLVQ